MIDHAGWLWLCCFAHQRVGGLGVILRGQRQLPQARLSSDIVLFLDFAAAGRQMSAGVALEPVDVAAVVWRFGEVRRAAAWAFWRPSRRRAGRSLFRYLPLLYLPQVLQHGVNLNQTWDLSRKD